MHFISAYSRCSSFGTHQAGFSGGEIQPHKIPLFDTKAHRVLVAPIKCLQVEPTLMACHMQRRRVMSHMTWKVFCLAIIAHNNPKTTLRIQMWHKWQNSQHPTHTPFQKTNKQTPLNRGCLCRQQVQGASLALLFLKTYATHHLLLFGNKVISCSLSKQPAVHALCVMCICWLVGLDFINMLSLDVFGALSDKLG